MTQSMTQKRKKPIRMGFLWRRVGDSKNICLPRLTKISSVKGYMSKMLGDEL